MKLLTIPAAQDAPAEVEDVKRISLEILQSKVHGYIEAVRFPDQHVVMYINEEGKLDGLPPNPRATEICRTAGNIRTADWISGDAVFVGETVEGEDTGLTTKDIAWIEGSIAHYK